MEHLNQDANQGGHSTGMVDRVRETAAAQLTTQKTRATEALGSVAAALRQSSQPLRDNNQGSSLTMPEKPRISSSSFRRASATAI